MSSKKVVSKPQQSSGFWSNVKKEGINLGSNQEGSVIAKGKLAADAAGVMLSLQKFANNKSIAAASEEVRDVAARFVEMNASAAAHHIRQGGSSQGNRLMLLPSSANAKASSSGFVIRRPSN